jgi:hypothetical protein
VPYVICGDCELLTYSAALWAGTEECPRCGAPLPTVQRSEIVSLAGRAGLLDNRSSAGEMPGTSADGDDG